MNGLIRVLIINAEYEIFSNYVPYKKTPISQRLFARKSGSGLNFQLEKVPFCVNELYHLHQNHFPLKVNYSNLFLFKLHILIFPYSYYRLLIL